MQINVVYNQGSGRGRAERVARRFEHALAAAGHVARLQRIGGGGSNGPGADLLVLIGGDGTVKHALCEAMASGVPVYHVPLGNENLFAREFGMTRDPADLVGAIGTWRPESMDVAVVEGGGRRDLFSIMLSVGPDASVIHRMETDGRAAGGHFAYLAPVGDELSGPNLAPVTVDVDGRRIVDGSRGLLVVSNLRHYAFGVNPAANADAHDGLLDVVFIPAATVGPLLVAAAWARIGRLARRPGVVSVRGRKVVVDAPGGAAQVDGEALHLPMPLRVGVEPSALRVLAPPRWRADRALSGA